VIHSATPFDLLSGGRENGSANPPPTNAAGSRIASASNGQTVLSLGRHGRRPSEAHPSRDRRGGRASDLRRSRTVIGRRHRCFLVAPDPLGHQPSQGKEHRLKPSNRFPRPQHAHGGHGNRHEAADAEVGLRPRTGASGKSTSWECRGSTRGFSHVAEGLPRSPSWVRRIDTTMFLTVHTLQHCNIAPLSRGADRPAERLRRRAGIRSAERPATCVCHASFSRGFCRPARWTHIHKSFNSIRQNRKLRFLHSTSAK
jgi:hypothetical protein